jgi:hypothetical protein
MIAMLIFLIGLIILGIASAPLFFDKMPHYPPITFIVLPVICVVSFGVWHLPATKKANQEQ